MPLINLINNKKINCIFHNFKTKKTDVSCLHHKNQRFKNDQNSTEGTFW